MEIGKKYHVVPKGTAWAVEAEKAKRASGLFPTKQEAVQRGRQLARNNRSQLYIHGKDGRIQEERTYHDDPYPPKG